VIAANNWTTLALGVTALLALAAALLPRADRPADGALPPFAAGRTTDADVGRFDRERQPAGERARLR
jgi:hypothetical protein